MATYQDIKGLRVKYLSADPGTLRAGEVWYNSTTGTLKGVVNLQSFSSGAPVSTARGWCAFAGDKSTALLVGGSINSYPSVNTGAEEYNGSGWTSATSAPFAGIGTVGCGTQTSALVFGGGHTYVNTTAEYDGSSWTVGGSMTLTCRSRSSAGTQTAGLGADAYAPGSQAVKTTEEYNGTGWTTVTSSGTARYDGAGLGIQTAAISCGGRNPPTTSLSAAEDYDGSAWTAAASMPEGKENQGASGSQTAATVFGGTNTYPTYPALNTKIDYDGSTWSTSPATLATGRRFFGGQGGTSADVLCASGVSTAGTGQTYITNTEEFNNTTGVVTAEAWASITAYPTPATAIGGVGSSTAGLFFGGEGSPGSVITTTTTYNGSAWTAGSAKGSASQLTMNFGTQASAVAAGGEPVPGVGTQVEEWGGSSWSTAPNTISDGRRNGGGSGSGEPSGVIFGGGEHPSYSTSCEAYDGTSWSEGGDLPNGKLGVPAGDSATAALFAGDAQNPSPPYSSNVSQEYNGTSWTATPSLLISRGNGPSGASTGANSGGGAYYAGGSYPSLIASMETYNGSAWSTAPSLGTAVWNQGGNGSTAGALSVGGSLPAYTAAAEEFSEATSVVTASTLTTS